MEHNQRKANKIMELSEIYDTSKAWGLLLLLHEYWTPESKVILCRKLLGHAKNNFNFWILFALVVFFSNKKH